MPSCASVLDGRSFSDGGSRPSCRRECQLRTDHVKSEAKGSCKKDLAWADHRSSDLKIWGAHPQASCYNANDGRRVLAIAPGTERAPAIENLEEVVVMGSDGHLTSPKTNGSHVESIKDLVNHIRNDEFMGGHMTISYDDMPEVIDTINSSSPPNRHCLSKHHELNESFDESEYRRWSRVREKEAMLPALRLRNLDTRIRVREARLELGELRSEMDAADNGYMALVREGLFRDRVGWVENGQTRSSIEQHELEKESSFRLVQATRDKYGLLQDSYHTLEAILNKQEHELAKLEKQVLKHGKSRQENQDDSDSLSSVSEDDDLEAVPYFETMYPSYSQYMSRLGDAATLEEDLAEVVSERIRLQEQHDIRRRNGRELLPEDREMLTSFPAEEAEIRNMLHSVNADVQRLRLLCIQEGLPDDREEDGNLGLGEPLLEEARDGSTGSTNEALPTSPTQSEYSRFRVLLENPFNEVDREKSGILITNFKSGNIGDRIECWLLHKLRSSYAEVELLARFFTSAFEEFPGAGPAPASDPKMWQEEVLEFWFFDSTNRPPSAYEIKPTAIISPGELTVKADATADNNTATLQPQSALQSELPYNDSLQSPLQSETFTCNSLHPTMIPLPPSPQPSMIPLPPSPFETASTPYNRGGVSPNLPSTVSTTLTTSNLPLTISTNPSLASTLPSPMLSPLPLPPPSLYLTRSTITNDESHDMTKVNGDGRQGPELYQAAAPPTGQHSGHYTNGEDSSNTQRNPDMQTGPHAMLDADTYRVEMVVRSSAIMRNQKS